MFLETDFPKMLLGNWKGLYDMVCKTRLRLGSILELGKVSVGLLKDLTRSVLFLCHETWWQQETS